MPPFRMAMKKDHADSSSEVVPLQYMYQTNQENTPLSCDLGKQVVPDDGKQFRGKNGEIEVVGNGDFFTPYVGRHQVRGRKSSRRKWLLLVGAVGLVFVLIAVLGGILGSRHTKSTAASPTSLSNVSTTSHSTITPQRNIAALSFTLNSINNTRVYLQDNVGQIIEAAERNNTWSISRTGIGGKNGSAIAAAVSRPDFSSVSLFLEASRDLLSILQVISVFYLDVNNIIHDISYSLSSGKWNMGTLSDERYTTMPNSSLTAMYNQCRLCANTTIIAFQDKNGFVQIGNHTSGGWTLTQLGPALEPQMGTGLALQPFYRNGAADQINLYYQKSNLNMSLASWKAASVNNGSPSIVPLSYHLLTLKSSCRLVP